jgi:hypothetical protein
MLTRCGAAQIHSQGEPTDLADGPGRVCPILLLSKHLNAGGVATITETDDSM